MTQITGQQHSYGVVVGVDGSDSSAHAAHWAAREAVSRAVPLTLVHALNLPTAGASLVHEEPVYVERSREEGGALLKGVGETLQSMFPDLVVNTQLSDLAPTSALAALGAQSELLVTGTRGRGGFKGLLLGSVTHGLAAHGDCPLTVVCDRSPRMCSTKSWSGSARTRSSRGRRSPTPFGRTASPSSSTGFSIGSNDLTQLTLGVDRDSEIVAFDYDERDDGVKEMIRLAVEGCRRNGMHSGLCGAGSAPTIPTWRPIWLTIGIDSMSLSPDTVLLDHACGARHRGTPRALRRCLSHDSRPPSSPLGRR